MSAALFRRTLSLTLVLLAALGVAAEADKLKEVIMTKPIEGLREIVKAAEINLPKGADPDDVEVPFLPTQTQPTLPYPAQPCPTLPTLGAARGSLRARTAREAGRRAALQVGRERHGGR